MHPDDPALTGVAIAEKASDMILGKARAMLSYQHEYHAGNHADVLKHAVLTLLIEASQRKPSPRLDADKLGLDAALEAHPVVLPTRYLQ